jgi:hypothetical protein
MIKCNLYFIDENILLTKICYGRYIYKLHKSQRQNLGRACSPQNPTLFNAKAKPWALPKPTREIISLDHNNKGFELL